MIASAWLLTKQQAHREVPLSRPAGDDQAAREVADRVVVALAADLGPAQEAGEPRMVTGDLFVGQNVEQRGGGGDRVAERLEVVAAELRECERGERADAHHPVTPARQGGSGAGCHRGPVGVEEVRQRQLAPELGRLGPRRVREPADLVQQQPAAGVLLAEQLVEDRREHRRLQPQLGRLAGGEREELVERVHAVLEPAGEPERGRSLPRQRETLLAMRLVGRDQPRGRLEPACGARGGVSHRLVGGLGQHRHRGLVTQLGRALDV